MIEQQTKEFRIERGSRMREYIRKFSSTEKAIFGLFLMASLVTSIIMTNRVNNIFMTEVPSYGGELREGVVGLPRAINPILAIADVDRDLSYLIYAGLMKYDNGKIVPDLADSYTVSDDGLTYTFKLKPGIYFQDGEPVTAEDVVFTIKKIQDPLIKSPRRADWINVTASEISPTEVQFVLKEAYSPFISAATIGILPSHIWSSVSDEQFIFSTFNTEPIGAGPFKISSVARDAGGIPTSFKLSTWRKYHGKEPYLENIVFSFFADEEKALQALDSGAIDSISAISAREGSRLSKDSAQNYEVLSSPMPRVFGIFLNQGQAGVLADATVRKALNMSVDRQAIVDNVLFGYGEPLYGPIPKESIGIDQPKKEIASAVSSTSKEVSPHRADLQGAIDLLEKNGWKKNANGIFEKITKTTTTLLSFEISTADTPDLILAADMVKKDWEALGANISIKVYEASDLYQNVIRTRKYDALLFGELIGKDRDVYAFWHSSQRNAPGLNVALYVNATADKLLDEIRKTTDEKIRQEKYTKLNEEISADIPAIFLYVPDFIYAVPRSLHGIELKNTVTSSDRWNSISNWYITTENVWKIFASNNN